MYGVVGAAVAGAGIVAEEIDATVQPVRQSFYVFVFLAVCTVLLIVSLLRHLRRAQANLGPAGEPGSQDPAAGPGAAAAPEGSAPSQAEGDQR